VLGGKALMGLWYHFAILFEALFILTTIDAGTRIGRFMLQDLLGQVWPAMRQTSWAPGAWLASAGVVAAWGWFLYQGVIDPLGGINSLWPLFGISNQLLAAIALCVGTTILLKMHKLRYAWITGLPLAWLTVVCFSAGAEKVWSASPKIGFLAHQASLAAKLAAGSVPAEKIAETQALMRNDVINATMTVLFLVMTGVILLVSFWEWYRILTGHPRARALQEAPPERVPEGATV
jgi:carbon starvation protein